MPSDVYASVTSAFGQDTENISGFLPKPKAKKKRRPAFTPPVRQIPTAPRLDPRGGEIEEQNRQLRTLAEGLSAEIEDLRGTQALSEFVAAEQERMGGHVAELASRQAFEAYVDGVREGVGVHGGTTRGGQREREGISHDTNWEAVAFLVETALTGGVRTIASNAAYEAAVWGLKKSNVPAPLEIGLEAMLGALALKKGRVGGIKNLVKVGAAGTAVGGAASAAGVGQGTSELLGGLLAAGAIEGPLGLGRSALTDRGQALGDVVETINVRQGPGLLARGDQGVGRFIPGAGARGGPQGYKDSIGNVRSWDWRDAAEEGMRQSGYINPGRPFTGELAAGGRGSVLNPATDFGPGRAGNVRSALGGVTERPTEILANTRFGSGGGFLRNVGSAPGSWRNPLGGRSQDIEGNLAAVPFKRVYSGTAHLLAQAGIRIQDAIYPRVVAPLRPIAGGTETPDEIFTRQIQGLADELDEATASGDIEEQIRLEAELDVLYTAGDDIGEQDILRAQAAVDETEAILEGAEGAAAAINLPGGVRNQLFPGWSNGKIIAFARAESRDPFSPGNTIDGSGGEWYDVLDPVIKAEFNKAPNSAFSQEAGITALRQDARAARGELAELQQQRAVQGGFEGIRPDEARGVPEREVQSSFVGDAPRRAAPVPEGQAGFGDDIAGGQSVEDIAIQDEIGRRNDAAGGTTPFGEPAAATPATRHQQLLAEFEELQKAVTEAREALDAWPEVGAEDTARFSVRKARIAATRRNSERFQQLKQNVKDLNEKKDAVESQLSDAPATPTAAAPERITVDLSTPDRSGRFEYEDPDAKAFISEIEDFVQRSGEQVTVQMLPSGPNRVYFIRLEALAQQEGAGTRVLNEITDRADEQGITIVGSAVPTGAAGPPFHSSIISVRKLKAFYQKAGFVFEDPDDPASMVYHPREAGTGIQQGPPGEPGVRGISRDIDSNLNGSEVEYTGESEIHPGGVTWYSVRRVLEDGTLAPATQHIQTPPPTTAADVIPPAVAPAPPGTAAGSEYGWPATNPNPSTVVDAGDLEFGEVIYLTIPEPGEHYRLTGQRQPKPYKVDRINGSLVELDPIGPEGGLSAGFTLDTSVNSPGFKSAQFDRTGRMYDPSVPPPPDPRSSVATPAAAAPAAPDGPREIDPQLIQPPFNAQEFDFQPAEVRRVDPVPSDEEVVRLMGWDYPDGGGGFTDHHISLAQWHLAVERANAGSLRGEAPPFLSAYPDRGQVRKRGAATRDDVAIDFFSDIDRALFVLRHGTVNSGKQFPTNAQGDSALRWLSNAFPNYSATDLHDLASQQEHIIKRMLEHRYNFQRLDESGYVIGPPTDLTKAPFIDFPNRHPGPDAFKALNVKGIDVKTGAQFDDTGLGLRIGPRETPGADDLPGTSFGETARTQGTGPLPEQMTFVRKNGKRRGGVSTVKGVELNFESELDQAIYLKHHAGGDRWPSWRISDIAEAWIEKNFPDVARHINEGDEGDLGSQQSHIIKQHLVREFGFNTDNAMFTLKGTKAPAGSSTFIPDTGIGTRILRGQSEGAHDAPGSRLFDEAPIADDLSAVATPPAAAAPAVQMADELQAAAPDPIAEKGFMSDARKTFYHDAHQREIADGDYPDLGYEEVERGDWITTTSGWDEASKTTTNDRSTYMSIDRHGREEISILFGNETSRVQGFDGQGNLVLVGGNHPHQPTQWVMTRAEFETRRSLGPNHFKKATQGEIAAMKEGIDNSRFFEDEAAGRPAAGERRPILPPSVRKELLTSAESIIEQGEEGDLLTFARELTDGAGKKSPSNGSIIYPGFSERGLVGLFREVENVIDKIEGGLELGTKRQTAGIKARMEKLRDELPNFGDSDRTRPAFDPATRGITISDPSRGFGESRRLVPISPDAPPAASAEPRIMEPIAEAAPVAGKRPSDYALPMPLSQSRVNFKIGDSINHAINFDSDLDRALFIATSGKRTGKVSKRRDVFTKSLNKFLPDGVYITDAAGPVRDAVRRAVDGSPTAESIRIPMVHTEMPAPSTLNVRTNIAAPIEGQDPTSPVGGMGVGPIPQQERLEGPSGPAPSGPPQPSVGPVPVQGQNLPDFEPSPSTTLNVSDPYAEPRAKARVLDGTQGTYSGIYSPENPSQPYIPGPQRTRDINPDIGPVPLPDASGATGRSPLKRQIELEGSPPPVKAYPPPRIQQAHRLPDGSLEPIEEATDNARPRVAGTDNGGPFQQQARIDDEVKQSPTQSVILNVENQKAARAELEGEFWKTTVDSDLDQRSSAMLSSGNLEDYINLKPSLVQGGLDGGNVQVPPGTVRIADEFLNGADAMQETTLSLGLTSDPGRMVDAIDKGLSDGPLARSVVYPTRRTLAASFIWRDAEIERIYRIEDDHFIVTREDRELAGKVLDHINSNEGFVSLDQLALKPEIRDLLIDTMPAEKTNILGYAQEFRRVFDGYLDNQNRLRFNRGQKLIPKRENYRPWILEKNWGSRMRNLPIVRKVTGGSPDLPGNVLDRAPELPDFIDIEGPFNPRAQQRNMSAEDLKKYELVTDIRRLAVEYAETARKDMFYTDIVNNAHAHTKVLRDMNMPRSASHVDAWIEQAYAGSPPIVSRALRGVSPGVMTFAVNAKRRLAASVFPFNWPWNVFVQTSSAAVTIAKYGTKNSIKGFDYFTDKEVRRQVKTLAHSSIVKGRRSGRVSVQDVSTGIERHTKLERSNLEKAQDWASFLTSAVEDGLTGVSIRAAYHRGEELGMEGRALWEFASDGGARTQSMYNVEDTVGWLRSPEVGVVLPFQTFAFEMFNTVRELNLPGVRGVVGQTGAYQTFGSKVPGELLDQRYTILARWIAAGIVINTVSDKAIDRKPWVVGSFIPFYSLFLGGADAGNPFHDPLPQRYVGDFFKGVSDYLEHGDWKGLRSWAIRYNMLGGTQANRMIEGIEAVEAGEVTDVGGRQKFEVGGFGEGGGVSMDGIVPKIDVPDWLRAYSLGVYQTEGGRDYIKENFRSEGPFDEYVGLGINAGGGRLGAREREWSQSELWGNYMDTKNNAADRKELGQKRSRIQQRKFYPELDAHLFLTGQVSTLQTNHAKSLARDLIREHDLLGLDPITIGDVIRPGKYGLSNEVSQFIIGDMDPDVLETWEKVLDLEKHGFGDPAPEADGQEAPVAPAPVAPAPAPTRTPSEQPPPKIFENQFFIPKSQRSSAVPQGTPNTVAGESPARQWETVQGDLSGADLRALQKVWGGGFLTPEEEKRLKVVHERHQLGEPNFNAWLKRRLRQIQTNAAVDAVRA